MSHFEGRTCDGTISETIIQMAVGIGCVLIWILALALLLCFPIGSLGATLDPLSGAYSQRIGWPWGPSVTKARFPDVPLHKIFVLYEPTKVDKGFLVVDAINLKLRQEEKHFGSVLWLCS
jgi:hypothetical protein